MANQFQLAEAYTELTLRDKKYNRRLNAVQANLRALQARMDIVARRAKFMLAGGIVAIGLFIKRAGDAEEVMSKFDAVFKDNAAEVRRWAQELGTALGRSQFKLQEFLSTFQDTFVPLGFARQEGAELSKQLVKLALDMASFNNASEPETIAALQSALVGNHETVRKYGVIITQATLDQELLNMGIAGGAKGADNMQKVMARLNIIMKGTTDAQGDLARTSGSLNNQIKALAASWDELSVAIGQTFIAPALQAVGWMRNIIPIIRLLVEQNKQQIVTWVKWTAAILALLIIAPKIIAFFALLVGAFRALAIARTILLALSGPKGLLLLVAGLTAGVAAGQRLNHTFGQLKKSIKASWQEAQRLGKETKKAATEQQKADKKRKQTTNEVGFAAVELDPKAVAAFAKIRVGPAGTAAAKRAAAPFREQTSRIEIGQRMSMSDVSGWLAQQRVRQAREDEKIQKQQLGHQASMDDNIKKIADRGGEMWK